MIDPLFIVVDLFCGAGGTTTGFVQAELPAREYKYYVGPNFKDEGFSRIAEVIACVNHDPLAIKSHWKNYKNVKHFEEDIRTLDLTDLVKLVEYYRIKYPNAKLILWASLECTNFSKAKGGQARDGDSRTLADHLDRYVVALNPEYIQIENVVEFMSWGPLDENGKPVSRKNGSDWMRWREKICAHGYRDEWQELNSANFGAFTSRNRLFGVFAKDGYPIAFPAPTHAKVPSKFSMYGDLQKWKAVKEVLNFEDEGESIFNRKKELSDKTLERIYAGLIKYVAKGDTAFISKYFSGRPKGKVNSVNDPAATVTTFGGSALVQPEFLVQTYAANSKGENVFSVDNPGRTITTRDSTQIVQPKFLTHYYGTSGHHSSVENPAPTVTTKARSAIVSPEFLAIYNGESLHRSLDEPCPVIATNDRFGLVQPVCLLKYDSTDKTGKHYPPSLESPAPVIITQGRLGLIQAEYFIDKHYGASQNQSIDQPAGTILPTDKHRLVKCEPFIMPTNYDNKPKSIEDPLPTITANRKHHYLVNPSWGGNPGSVDEPCCVIVARQDKAPLYFIQVEQGPISIAIYDSDSEIMIKIKQFMLHFHLVDIKMRMLRVLELLKIQGFPSGYILEGNQSDQKKFIGNSVVPHVVKAWTEALACKIIEFETRRKVA